MAVDEKVISKLEKLAKIKLSKEERTEMKVDLDKMIIMINKLSEVDTSNTEPLLYIHNEKNVLRTDTVHNVLERENGLSNAPHREGDYFAVPKIINK